MSEKFRLDRKIGFQNTFYTKCINVIIDSIGPSIILRSIFCPQTHPRLRGLGSKGQTLSFSESSHVAYQIKGN